MLPTVGRIVNYNVGTKEDPKLLAAVVCWVWNDTLVNLMVINVNGLTEGKTSVVQGENGNEWSWPIIKK